MALDWQQIDRFLIGEAWVGSRFQEHLTMLCDTIGPRWASSPAEWQTVNYIRDQLAASGLHQAALEEYALHSWRWSEAAAQIVEDETPVLILPFNRCPPVTLTAPLVDVGFGTPHLIDEQRARLPGAIAIMALTLEPFTPRSRSPPGWPRSPRRALSPPWWLIARMAGGSNITVPATGSILARMSIRCPRWR